MFKAQRRGAESLGDFTARVGFDALRAFQGAYIAPEAAQALPKVGQLPCWGLGGGAALGVCAVRLLSWQLGCAAQSPPPPPQCPQLEADGRPGRPPRAAPVKTVQVGIAEDVYEALTAAADKAGQPIESVATEAIRKHLGM